ncbi:MAG: cyclic nucleotide-binding domain-containing protein [Planctomycetota bacterium]|jgi:CRP/FNR family cyclic AMP-dependent transcriptional regulator|nr:cyclic nucleotide-binding domain-containing protein [Planctomycetota bacterium]
MITVDPSDLARYSLFAGLGEEHLCFVLEGMGRVRYQPGDKIVEQGSKGDSVYFILSGSVEIVVDGVAIAGLDEGSQFGEMHLIDVQTRSATVRALTRVDALTLSNQDLLALRRRNADACIMILMNCARDVSRRLRAMNKRFAATPMPEVAHPEV